MLDMKKIVFSIVVFFSVNLYADLFNVHGVYLDHESGVWTLCSGLKGEAWPITTEKLSPAVSPAPNENRALSDFPVARRVVFILDSRGKLTLNERDLYRSLFNALPLKIDDEVGIISFGAGTTSARSKNGGLYEEAYYLLKPTSDRAQLHQALVAYESLFSSGPDYTVSALTKALEELHRDSANASFREAIVLVLHKMPNIKGDLSDALDSVMGRNGRKVPIFALVLGDEQRLSHEWTSFFEGTGGKVICVDKMTTASFLKGVMQLQQNWDSQQGYLYSRNNSLESPSLSRSITVSYHASVEGESAIIDIPIVFQDRQDVLNGRLQKALLEKVQKLTVLDSEVDYAFQRVVAQMTAGHYKETRVAANQVNSLVGGRQVLLVDAEELSKKVPSVVTVDFARLLQKNREMADRVDEYTELMSGLARANNLFEEQRVDDAAIVYKSLTDNSLLPAIEKARIFFILSSLGEDEILYRRQGIALVESERIYGQDFSTELLQRYAWALLGEGRYSDAEKEVLELQNQRTDLDVDRLNFICGVALYKQGQVNRAAVYVDKAISNDPKYREMFKEYLAK